MIAAACYCTWCHRPLKHATETGMGPVCSRRFAAPVPAYERDLFGFDIDKAVHAAEYRLQVRLDASVLAAQMGIRHGFLRARERLLP